MLVSDPDPHDKLSDALNAGQKKLQVRNLLQGMINDGLIAPDGATRWAKWHLAKQAPGPKHGVRDQDLNTGS